MPEGVVPRTHQHYAALRVRHALNALLDALELAIRSALMLQVPSRREVDDEQLIVAIGEAGLR